jgi:hypothetical protein
VDRGFDSASFWEQAIVWGDHDAFQYVIISIVFSLCLTCSLGTSIMLDMVHIDRTCPGHPGLPSPLVVRFFESSRIRWISSIGEELGGQAQADAFLRARGISFILKSIGVNFRKPVQYPDTVSLVHLRSFQVLVMNSCEQLLIAHKPALEPDPKRARTQFLLHAGAFSYAQRAVVADSMSVITWYDYDRVAKCDPGDDYWAPIIARMK